MNIEETIADLEQQLEQAKAQRDKGYHSVIDCGEDYYISNTHTVVYDLDGSIAGIIVDTEVVLKFLGEEY